MNVKHIFLSIGILLISYSLLTGCTRENSTIEQLEIPTAKEPSIPVVEHLTHVPELSGIMTSVSDFISIDYSHCDSGYIMVDYLGNHTGKVKFQITGPDNRTYTFNLAANTDVQTFPLTGGSGLYTLNTFEQASGTDYYTVDSCQITAEITDPLTTYLYPNQFIYYTADSKVLDLSIEAAQNSTSEIDLISNVYNKAMDTIDYDTTQAELAANGTLAGYIPELDSVITSGKGICFDYASLMVAMLRIQELPAKLVIGYAGEAYHAWISVYTVENGWIDNVISFNGKSWTLMDPTFADNASDQNAIHEYIGDGSNYTEKYVY